MPTSVNRLIEAGSIRRPSWLISINRGGCFKATASDNILTKAVALGQPPRFIDINRGGRLVLLASVND